MEEVKRSLAVQCFVGLVEPAGDLVPIFEDFEGLCVRGGDFEYLRGCGAVKPLVPFFAGKRFIAIGFILG